MVFYGGSSAAAPRYAHTRARGETKRNQKGTAARDNLGKFFSKTRRNHRPCGNFSPLQKPFSRAFHISILREWLAQCFINDTRATSEHAVIKHVVKYVTTINDYTVCGHDVSQVSFRTEL